MNRLNIIAVWLVLALPLTASAAAATGPHIIYAAGSYFDSGVSHACYWKGPTRVDLAGDGKNGAGAQSVFVSGSTVYTAGYYSDGAKDIACYWTGTTRTDLAGDGHHNARATSLFVDGKTVYVAGYYSDGGKETPCYWTGTTRTDLPVAASNGGEALSIVVVAATVYSAGYSEIAQNKSPCYWTGTKRTDLLTATDSKATPATKSPVNGAANAIFVLRGTIYTAGYYVGTDQDVPCYWTGTKRTDLPVDKPAGTDKYNGYANSITVVGGVVYAAGLSQKQVIKDTDPIYLPCCWVGNKKVDLPGDGKHKGSAYAVAVVGGAIYTAGFYSDATTEIPCIWNGTKRMDLRAAKDDAEAYSVFVQ